MSSKKLEDYGTKAPVLELLLPISLYWEVESLLKRIDYMLSASEDPVLITDLTQRIYRKVQKYVVTEKDRAILHQRLHSGG